MFESAVPYGDSKWSATAVITTRVQDGSRLRFFVKYATGDHGRKQLEGEFRSMQEISTIMPGFAPKPIGYGKLEAATSELPTFFFLSEFVSITNELPDPKALAGRLAQMHQSSQSPTGKFGFYTTTYDGRLPQNTDYWEDSWSTFFDKLLTGIAELDTEVNGPWSELQEALIQTSERVIPRLLGVLEAGGRKVKPCLIHGDLWEGNIGTDIETGNLYIFDAACYYAHNEMELGIWRTDHHKINSKAYRTEYLRNYEASEPVEEWDDRNRLYSVKTQLMYSAHVPGTQVRNA